MSPLIPLIAALVGCGSGSADTAVRWTGNNTETLALDLCSAECPSGTQQAEYSSLEILGTEAFYVMDGECQSVCEPTAPCVWPNVPVVTKEEGYGCLPLEGFSTFPATADVDFGWAEVQVALPWEIDSSYNVDPDHVVAADLDGDGLDDVVVALGNNVELHLSNGSGGFASYLTLTADPIEQIFVGDRDGDGADELFVREVDGSGVRHASWYAFTGNGLGARNPIAQLGARGAGPAVLDVDGDGSLDIAYTSSDAGLARIGLDAAGPVWTDLWSCVGANCGDALLFGDVDGDGAIDLWSPDAWARQTGPGVFAITGGASFGGIQDSLQVGFADFDGDGAADILQPTRYGPYDSAAMLNHSATGAVWPDVEMVTSDCGWPAKISIGDVDGDGLPEAAMGHSSCNDESIVAMFDRHDLDGGGVDSFSLAFREIGGWPVIGDFDSAGEVRLVTVVP